MECTCNVRVVATTSDGASPNRRLYRMHKGLSTEEEAVGVVYKTINLYDRERCIYFFSDASHIPKTVRNCIYNSGDGKKTRHMWKDGKLIVWKHISDLQKTDAKNQLKLIPKLKNEHVNLTPYSAMRVYLAAQILSNTVYTVLSYFERKE